MTNIVNGGIKAVTLINSLLNIQRVKMPQKPKYPWDTIRKEYRTGTYSDSELARRHGCSRRAIQKRVEREGWTKDLSEAVKQSLRAKLVKEDAKVASQVAGRNANNEDESDIDRAAETRLAVVQLHRKDINSLRELEAKLIDEIFNNPTKLYLAQYQGTIIQKTVGLTAAEKAMAANNLANVQHKRIALERQAFNLNDTGDGGSDGDNTPANGERRQLLKEAAREFVKKVREQCPMQSQK